MRRGLGEGRNQCELRMGSGVAPEQVQRSVNVAQGAEGGVHGGLLEDRARIEDARELCGGQTPGVQRELLDPAQTLGRRGGMCLMDMQAGSRWAMPLGDGSCG